MSKTVLFQTLQFIISTQFQYKKTFLFQIIQFSISTQISSIRPIDRTLPGSTTPGQSGPGRYSAFPKAPALLELHHRIVSCYTRDTRWGKALPLCRDAVGIFYSPSRLVGGLFDVSTQPTLVIQPPFINFRSNIIGPYGIIPGCR